MRCFDARPHLSALLDGAGEVVAREATARHVGQCATCRAELDAMAATDRAMKSALDGLARPPGQDYFEGFWPRLEARLGAARDEEVEIDDLKALAAATISRRSGTLPIPTVGNLDASSSATLGQVVLPAAAGDSEPPVDLTPRRSRSWRSGWMVGAAALVSAGAVALVLLMRAGPTASQAPPSSTAEEPARPAAVPPPPPSPPAAQAPPVVIPVPAAASAPSVAAPATVPAAVPPPEPEQPQPMAPPAPAAKPPAATAKPAKTEAKPDAVKPAPAKPEAPKPEPAKAPETKEGGAAPPPPAPPPELPKEKQPASLPSAEELLKEVAPDKKPADPAPGATGNPSAPPSGPRHDKLSHEEITAGMDGVAGEVQACKDKLPAGGMVIVRVKIMPDGGVAETSADGKFAGSEVGSCVAAAAKHAKFVTFDGAAMTIKYPFRLEEE